MMTVERQTYDVPAISVLVRAYYAQASGVPLTTLACDSSYQFAIRGHRRAGSRQSARGVEQTRLRLSRGLRWLRRELRQVPAA